MDWFQTLKPQSHKTEKPLIVYLPFSVGNHFLYNSVNEKDPLNTFPILKCLFLNYVFSSRGCTNKIKCNFCCCPSTAGTILHWLFPLLMAYGKYLQVSSKTSRKVS